jgi:hypothetical protein
MIKKSYSVFVIIVLFLSLLFHSACSSSDYTIVLIWDVPTTNTDGTPLTDLAGYELFMGTSSHKYSRTINIPIGDGLLSCKDVGDNKDGSKKITKCSYTVMGLQQGDYYFVISAYNTSGKKSVYSNEVKKTASRGIWKKRNPAPSGARV